jgi:hypothetical protein
VNKRRSHAPINELLDYWINISKRPTLTLEDYELFFEKVTASNEYFEKSYPNYVRSDKFLTLMTLLWFHRDRLLKAETEEQLSNNAHAHMRNVAKKFIRRIKECFSRDIIVAVERKTPLQDAEAILGQSNKLTYRWAAGIVVSNHIATLLIQLSRFRTGEKYKDDIRTLADNLKNRTTNRKLKTFLTRSHRRIEDADKLRNRCAHVIEGEPTKQEIQQSIAFARLLQKYISAVSRGPSGGSTAARGFPLPANEKQPFPHKPNRKPSKSQI